MKKNEHLFIDLFVYLFEIVEVVVVVKKREKRKIGRMETNGLL